MSFTKGDWEIDNISPKDVIIRDATGFIIMRIPCKTEANARLIAAAPKLLEACKELVNDREALEEDEGFCACQCLSLATTADPRCAYCVAKQAIAAAEGRGGK